MSPTPELEVALSRELIPRNEDGPNVVAIGGGAGLAQTLHSVQDYAGSITAVVSVADDGGSSGRLIEGLDIPPPGDLRKSLLALTPQPSLIGELFNHRFGAADVAGHSLGNLILAALSDLTEDFATALEVAGNLLRINGRVLPASKRRLLLIASIDGELVDGQVAIGRTEGNVESLRVDPGEALAYSAVVDAITEADQIVLAPGSLYTSLLAALVVPGVAAAVNQSKASLTWVLNLITQDAETLDMDGAAHLEALQTIGGVTRAGTIVTHTGLLEVPLNLASVSISELDALQMGWVVASGDLSDRESQWPQHDPFKLGTLLAELA
jgi:uncharacterized cofD-like protein